MRRVFRGLALRVVKIRRHGNYRAKNIVVKAVFRTKAQRRQYFCAHFHWAFLAGNSAHFDHTRCVDQGVWQAVCISDIGQASAHQSLDRGNRVTRVCALLLQSLLSDLAALRIEIAHHARQQDCACCIGQTFGHTVTHSSHQRMRSTQVDADGNAPLVWIGRLARFGNLEQGHK